MDVHDAVWVGADQDRRDDPHVPRQRDQLNVMLLEDIQDRSIIRFAAVSFVGKRLGVQEHAGQLVAARAFQGLRLLLVADDNGDQGIQRPGLDGVDDRLKVGPAPRRQNAEPQLTCWNPRRHTPPASHPRRSRRSGSHGLPARRPGRSICRHGWPVSPAPGRCPC